jgi:hypothetical protein
MVLLSELQMNQPDSCTKGLERRPMDDVNGAYLGFLLLGFSCIPFHLPVTYISEPKALVTVMLLSLPTFL